MTDVSKIIGKPSTRHEIAVYVPSTINSFVDGQKIVQPLQPALRTKIIRMVQVAMCERFGGVSKVDVQGSWVDSDTKELVHEDVDKIYSLAGDLSVSEVKFVHNIALNLKAGLGQDCVLLTIDHMGWFV